MAPVTSVPAKIGNFHVLPLNLPALKALPNTQAIHYLYIRAHEPKIPTPSTDRSLYLANVPFDAAELHIKGLFATQLDLPTGRVSAVRFWGEGREGGRVQDAADVGEDGKTTTTATPSQAMKTKTGKKRKRIEESADLVALAMPDIWDRELQKPGASAVVEFVDRTSMEAAFKAVKAVIKKRRLITWGEELKDKLPDLGIRRYINHHSLSYPDKAVLLDSVNSYMTSYNAQEASRKRLQTRQRQEPDEDGFVTVTRGGRTGVARQEAAQEKLEQQKGRQKGMEDFYRFQTREKRKERAGELIKRFEEDREKVRKMKEGRGRFRPEK